MAELHHERMSPHYDPPPPAYDKRVGDCDDVRLHSKPGSFSYVLDDDDAVKPDSGHAPDVDKTDV